MSSCTCGAGTIARGARHKLGCPMFRSGIDNSDCDWPTVDGVQHEKGTVTTETLQPFDKMRPGEVDKVFQASCPKCDGRVWVFVPIDTGPVSGLVADPDARACQNCGYIHWLRGPNTSEIIPLPTAAGPAKKDRVRALVFAILASPSIATYPADALSDFVRVAQEIDSKIEASK
jgi:hypothetical protein